MNTDVLNRLYNLWYRLLAYPRHNMLLIKKNKIKKAYLLYYTTILLVYNVIVI